MKPALVRDVVCGMELRKDAAREFLLYGGHEFYFCSVGCRSEFERHPEDYAHGAQSEDGAKDDV